MIKANFNAYDSYVTDSLYQWDLNQVLSVSGLNLTVAPEVHFSNAILGKSLVRQAELDKGVVNVNIPNSLLQNDLDILAYVGLYEGSTFKVIETVRIPVIKKEKPEDYKIENDEEIYSFNELENKIVNAKDDMRKYADNKNATLSAQVANIITHNNDTDGNTELIDIRTGADGTVYGSSGEAVRSQVRDVKGDLFDIEKSVDSLTNKINLYDGKYYTGGFPLDELVDDTTGAKRIAIIPCKPNTQYWIVRDKATDKFGRIKYATSEKIENGITCVNLVNNIGSALKYSVTTGDGATFLCFYYTYNGDDQFIQITDFPCTTLLQNTYPLLKDIVYTKKEVDNITYKNVLKCYKNGDELGIYMPSPTSDKYIRFIYKKVVNESINFNQWKVMDIDVCDKDLSVLYHFYADTNDVEWEGVVRETGTSDFIGGYHGDEVNQYLCIMVDGKVINSDFSIRNCEEILIVNESIINRCDTPSDKLFRRYKVSKWNKDNYTIENRWIALANNISLDRIYMTMLSVPVQSGTYKVGNYGRYNDKYIIQPRNGDAVPNSCLYNSTYADTVEFFDDDFYCKCQGFKNEDVNQSVFCDRSQPNIFKGYWRQYDKVFNLNDEIKGKSIYTFKF